MYDELRDKFNTDSQSKIDGWEKGEKIASIKLELGKHEGVKILLAELQKKIDAIDSKLVNKRKMTETERNILFVEKDSYNYLINFFGNAKIAKDSIEKQVAEANKLT